MAVLLLGGCGRIAFDAAPDASVCTSPAGHDEDGDGVDDACDTCPQLAAAQNDTDGDDVGDACDPATTLQQRTLFDPFLGPRPEWIYSGTEVFSADVLEHRAVGGAIYPELVDPPQREVYELAGVVRAGGTGQRQLTIQIRGTTGPPTFFCELVDSGDLQMRMTYTLNGTNYVRLGEIDLLGRLDVGSLRLMMNHAPPDWSCEAEWLGERHRLSAAIPAGIPPDRVTIHVADIDLDATSFVRLLTP